MSKILRIILTLALFLTTQNLLAQDFDEDEFAAFESEFSSQSNGEIYDPFEKFNRKIFVFNDFLDRNAFEPIAKGYRKYTPGVVRKSVRNFTTNVTLPMSTLNSFAQGRIDNALATFSHFLINSTVGILGIFDVASKKKIKYEREDFGQTLGNYGVSSGPYLVLPFFGPSNLRDLSGNIVDRYIDPASFNGFNVEPEINDEFLVVNGVATLIDRRESLIEIVSDARKESFDLYSTMKSFYTQNRISNINK